MLPKVLELRGRGAGFRPTLSGRVVPENLAANRRLEFAAGKGPCPAGPAGAHAGEVAVPPPGPRGLPLPPAPHPGLHFPAPFHLGLLTGDAPVVERMAPSASSPYPGTFVGATAHPDHVLQ